STSRQSTQKQMLRSSISSRIASSECARMARRTASSFADIRSGLARHHRFCHAGTALQVERRIPAVRKRRCLPHHAGIRYARPFRSLPNSISAMSSYNAEHLRRGFADEYPFASHFLDLDGVRYHYIDEGRGETLLC